MGHFLNEGRLELVAWLYQVNTLFFGIYCANTQLKGNPVRVDKK
jgi:hypothetical protein